MIIEDFYDKMAEYSLRIDSLTKELIFSFDSTEEKALACATMKGLLDKTAYNLNRTMEKITTGMDSISTNSALNSQENPNTTAEGVKSGASHNSQRVRPKVISEEIKERDKLGNANHSPDIHSQDMHEEAKNLLNTDLGHDAKDKAKWAKKVAKTNSEEKR